MLSGFLLIAVGVVVGRWSWGTGDQLSWSMLNVIGLFAGGIALAVGIGTLAQAFQRSGPCPACGHVLLEQRGCAECPGCDCFVYVANDEWARVPEETVADEPFFASALPQSVIWPSGCCVCRGPVDRTIRLSITVLTAREAFRKANYLLIGWLRFGGYVTHLVDVPHCGVHMNGAWLEEPGVGPVKIRFRSHAYAREFRALNSAKARNQ
jgi:hypothetical protein